MQYVQGHRSDQGKKMRELSRSEIEHLIDEWILSERDRAIAKRRMIDGIYFEPLAEEFDLSVRQVKKIVYRAQDKVYRHAENVQENQKDARN